MDLERYHVLNSLLCEKSQRATDIKRSKTGSAANLIPNHHDPGSRCEKFDSRHSQTIIPKKLKRLFVTNTKTANNSLLTNGSYHNDSPISPSQNKSQDLLHRLKKLTLPVTKDLNDRPSAMRGTILNTKTTKITNSSATNRSLTINSSTTRRSLPRSNSTRRELYPFERSDNIIIKPINSSHTKSMLKDVTEEYMDAFKDRKKKEGQERFISRLLNSTKAYEQFENLNIKRQKIYGALANRIRKENAEIISQNNKLWISPLTTYQKSSYTRVDERQQQKTVIDLSKTRTKLLQNFKPSEKSYSPSDRPNESTNKQSSKMPQQYHYDRGTFMKYMFDFINLSKMTREIEVVRTLGDEDPEGKSLDPVDVEAHVENVVKMGKVNSPSDLFHNSKDMQKYLKTQSIFLYVLKENYSYMFKDRKIIADQILLALGINPEKEFNLLDWEAYLKFAKTAVHYMETPRSTLAKFIIKFFKLNEPLLSVSRVRAVFRVLGKEMEDKLPQNKDTSFYNSMLQNWSLVGIVSEESPYVNVENLMLVYASNKLDVYQLLDVITHKYAA